MSVQFLKPKFIVKEVNEKKLHFYAPPVLTILKLSDFATPLTHALVAVFQDTNGDQGRVTQDYQTPDGEQGAKTSLEPLSVDLARYRDGSRRDAISKLIGGLTSPEARLMLGEVIMESLREEFTRPKGGFTPEQVKEFIENPDLDGSTAVDLLSGVMEASKGIFGPFAEAATAVVEMLKTRVGAVVEAAKSATSTNENETPG